MAQQAIEIIMPDEYDISRIIHATKCVHLLNNIPSVDNDGNWLLIGFQLCYDISSIEICLFLGDSPILIDCNYEDFEDETSVKNTVLSIIDELVFENSNTEHISKTLEIFSNFIEENYNDE